MRQLSPARVSDMSLSDAVTTCERAGVNPMRLLARILHGDRDAANFLDSLCGVDP